VNSAGWVVGNDSSAFSIPFLYDGTTTYRLADLLPNGSGWDLSMNTSSSALGISDNGVIVGTGVHNGATHAYAMVPALQLTLAVSRKTHGGAGTFDIPLPLSGSPGVECRTGGGTGDYTLVFTFTNNVTSGNASVTGGIGSVSGTPVFSGNNMTVNLTGVANAQTLTVTLSGVTDEFSQVLPDTPVSVNMLIGDTSGNGVVNATDVAQTKAQVGQPVNGSNFRTDVNASGIINATDVAIVKTHSGASISARLARARTNAATATGH
jgi:Dockerin type I domain